MGKNQVILVSNDDGVHSAGLSRLAEALEEIGEIYVVAPDRERNAAGHALTLHKPLRVEEIRKRVYSVNGTPTDCVNLGTLHLLKGKKPSLVVSGINNGGNLGDDVTYSGTVSAAMEGTLLGIPSIAVSLVSERPAAPARARGVGAPAEDPPPHYMADGNYQFETAARFTVALARLVLEEGLSRDVFLNVNVPNLPPNRIKEARITALGKRIFDQNAIIEKTDPRGRKYYWIGANGMAWEKRKGADHEAIEEGAISVTPLHLDLTHHETVERLRSWRGPLSKSMASSK